MCCYSTYNECSLFSIIEEHEAALSNLESNYAKEMNDLK